MIRHTVIDVEAVLDPNVPAKEGSEADEHRLEPPVRWQVVALGCFSFVDYEPERFGCIVGATERDIIDAYVSYLETDKPVVVTWNGRFFDNPVIGFRALRYLIPMPWWYGSARGPRYRYADKALDVKDALADFGASKTASQSQVARLIGWPGKGEITGEDVARLHAAGERAQIERYCLGDVATLSAIWLRYEALRGNISRRQWPQHARRLLAFLEKNVHTASMIAKVDRPVFIEGGDARQLALIP